MRVIDKRMFTSDGELKEEVRKELDDLAQMRRDSPPPPPAPPAPEPKVEEPPKATPPEEGPADPRFARLVMTLANQAGLYLGLVVDPLNPGGSVDLAAARTITDMLAVIAEKTKGNVNSEESQMIESVLYELQVAYVEKSKRSGRG
jgi:hypothetical protein